MQARNCYTSVRDSSPARTPVALFAEGQQARQSGKDGAKVELWWDADGCLRQRRCLAMSDRMHCQHRAGKARQGFRAV